MVDALSDVIGGKWKSPYESSVSDSNPVETVGSMKRKPQVASFGADSTLQKKVLKSVDEENVGSEI